jgi:tRNA(Arg) A34 adenosine deaminase TadA
MHKYIKTTIRLYRHENTHKYNMFAVLFKSGQVITQGYNDPDRKSFWLKHILGYKKSQGLHAEIKCLLDSSNTKGGIMVIYGKTKSGCEITNTKPCDFCMKAIKYVGIKRIYFLVNHKWSYENV